ncbi:MAG: beta-lactamase family protein, partial [Cyclobacteriaceae bacterium]|nr:beta-lactamase family protein [Cyclobacteriaceae bacterium]
ATRQQAPGRGLGWRVRPTDRAALTENMSRSLSARAFGHTGFTGTFAWMDPETRLLYIFLSNRVNPTRDNTRLYRLNTRTEVQQVLYDALEEKGAFGIKEIGK